MWVGGERHAPAALPPGKDPVVAGWGPGPVWTGVENLAATGIRCPARQARNEPLFSKDRSAFKNVFNYFPNITAFL
jgi:hypothetical protein